MNDHRLCRLTVMSLVIALCAGRPAGGEEAAQRLIAKLSPDDFTPELTRAIAEVGVPTDVTVKAGETLGQLVARHCGREDANFIGVLRDKSEFLGIPADRISADYHFRSTRRLELPYCLPQPPRKSLWRGYSMGSGHEILFNPEKTMSLGKPVGKDSSLKTWTGDQWKLGGGSTWGWYSWDPSAPTLRAYADGDRRRWDTDIFGDAVVEDREPATYIALPVREGVAQGQAIAMLNNVAPQEQKFRGEERGIKHVTVLSSGEDNCRSLPKDRLPENYPVKAYEILRVLGLNRAARPRRETQSVRIIIGDSGLYYEPLAGGLQAHAVDTERPEAMAPDPHYVRSQHGTYVATAALGGPYFMRFLSLFGSDLVVQARNIISAKNGCQAVVAQNDASALPKTYDYCEIEDPLLSNLVSAGKSGGIVNLSVSHLGRISDFENELITGRDRFLVVVAAGNTGKPIVDKTYPQMLPHDDKHKKNVIVVAALESTGDVLADKSSYHPSWVELAAYGCKIPVYEYDGATSKYRIVPESGTSMAAPLVTFAAALLKTQGDLAPAIIKKRLLVSADFETGLAGKVKNSARLNTARALALFHDVVELSDGSVIYGKVANGDDFVLTLCGGRHAKSRDELRSLSLFSDENGKKNLFFYYGVPGDRVKLDAGLDEETCLLSEPNPDDPGFDLATFPLTIENAETGKENSFALGQVKNITFADEPYWEN